MVLQAQDRLGHRDDIQGLRALAILLVVGAHAGVPGLAGGVAGVDVFYVLSGYLITGLLLQEHAATGRLRVVEFYARRLKRLLPALLLMLVATLLAATWLLSPGELREQARSAPYAATWTGNLFFALARMDYFAEPQARDLFLHTWSLGVEEQYYLVWPWLLLLAVKGGRVGLALGLVFAASLGLFAHWSQAQPLWAFYQMPARGWQFALGAGALLLARRPWRPGALRAAGVAGLLLILASAMLLKPSSPGLWLLVPSAGAALVLAGGSRLLAQPALVWIGDRSYAWYLWHWPFLVLGAAAGVRAPAGAALLVAASLAMAAASYALVERPLWKGPRARALPARQSVAAALLAMGVVLAGPVLWSQRVAHAVPTGAAAVIAAARLDVPDPYKAGCDDWYESAEPKACLFGPDEAPRTAVLIGDSIGMQWYPLFRELLPEPEWRLVVLTKSACPMVDEDYFYARIKAVYAVCRQWRDAVLGALPPLKPDLVVIGSSGNYPFTEAQWVEGSARVLRFLKGVTPRLVVVAPTPALAFDGPGCLERGRGDCSSPVDAAAVAVTSGYLRDAIERAGGGVGLLELGDLVCPGGTCAARAPDGTIVFRDAMHLTASFARAQAQAARPRIP